MWDLWVWKLKVVKVVVDNQKAPLEGLFFWTITQKYKYHWHMVSKNYSMIVSCINTQYAKTKQHSCPCPPKTL